MVAAGTIGGIIAGAPELVVEVADSSRATDLGPKRLSYEQGNCLEYLVFSLAPPDILWHIRLDDKLTPVVPDADGILRSRAFPGLWLDSNALIANDLAALIATLNQGLAMPEHAAFVARLAAALPQGENP